ncbi:uncharacterized protein LOC131430839 [Malaya genurostris]|uniref:uncharacterized protein LOC131430839 n=1 Tax=Malaya genurostris TaxID=325434 RepID=UPI0026F3C08B|nr:uncharacterized protein LOC131430839 [Malaya genurostris]
MKVILCLLVIAVTTAQAIDVHQCGGEFQSPIRVTIPGCDVMPCEIPNQTDMSFEVLFAPSFPTSTLAVNVTATLGDFNLPYETPDHLRNGCDNIDASCPLVTGQEVTLKGTAPVEAPLTNVTVRMRFEIDGDDDRSVICFAADVRLV